MRIYLLYHAGSAKVKYAPGYDVKIWHQRNPFPVFHKQIYIHDTYMKNNTDSDRRNICDKTRPAYNTNYNLYNITSQRFFKLFYTWCSLADCRSSDWNKLYLSVFSVYIVYNTWRGYVLGLPCCLSTFRQYAVRGVLTLGVEVARPCAYWSNKNNINLCAHCLIIHSCAQWTVVIIQDIRIMPWQIGFQTSNLYVYFVIPRA